MNMAELLKSSKEANNIYVMTAIVLVVIAMLISSFIARSITLPIQKLRDSMERVQEGDFKAADDLVIPSKNEIGSLTTSFNVMTHKIEDLMAQNVHEQELKRKSELKALQSQINPHFLYILDFLADEDRFIFVADTLPQKSCQRSGHQYYIIQCDDP